MPSAHTLRHDELPRAEAAADALRINGHVVDVCSTGKKPSDVAARLVITDLKLGDTAASNQDARTIHPSVGQ